MNKYLSLTLLFFLLFPSSQAFAACTSPAGAESQSRYDFTAHKLYYCDNTNWIESGGSSGGVIPVKIFSGTVTTATTTVPGVTYPAYYMISSSVDGYENNGNKYTCTFRIKINGSWVTLASQYGNADGGSNYFTAHVMAISASETIIGGIDGNSTFSGTWNGDAVRQNSASCPNSLMTVVRLD